MRKRVFTGFLIFLGGMAFCTVLAKGIYTSGLAIVSMVNPTGSSLVHEVRVTGKVREGQEYGVYVESGLRVATIKVREGQSFSASDGLFQIDTDDLRRVIGTYERELLQFGNQKTKYEKAVLKDKENMIARLQKLLDDNGWVYANRSGKVTRIGLSVGDRTPDAACIVYALDEGRKIVEADFTKEQTEHLTLGDTFSIRVKQRDGKVVTEEVILSYLDKKSGGESRGEFFYENDDVALGQSAELCFKKRTEIYDMCIRRECLHQKSVFVVEEREGILGTEQRVRCVPITIVDENEAVVAIESVDIGPASRIVISPQGDLKDGDRVRLLEG